MKKKIKLVIPILTFSLILSSTFINLNFVEASSVQPGSSQDPLVSKSYVDANFAELENMINNGNNGGNNYTPEDTNTLPPSVNESESTYVPVQLLTGQTLVGNEGTEIILRTGKAVTYTQASNGIVNVTKGTELYNNDPIETNNLLIIPRQDGRGVTATTDCWLLVKGGYEIIK